MLRTALTPLICFAVATSALAADPVGKWAGKVEIQASKEIKSMMKNQGPDTKFSLSIKADKTYTGTQESAGKSLTSSGTWVQKGNTVILTAKLRDGKPATGDGAKPRSYTLSPDGKSLSMDITSIAAQRAKQMSKPGEKGKPATQVTLPPGLKVLVILKKI